MALVVKALMCTCGIETTVDRVVSMLKGLCCFDCRIKAAEAQSQSLLAYFIPHSMHIYIFFLTF